MEGSEWEYDDKVSEREIISEVTAKFPYWPYWKVVKAKEEIMKRYRKVREEEDADDQTD